MSLNAYLPPVPLPPHDPKTWVLNAQAGWRTGDVERVTENAQGELVLASLDAGLSPDVTLPSNLAGSHGDVWLLDSEQARLRYFDRCECRFETVPYIGGVGSAPRRFDRPHGLGFADGLLYVCDSGNHRIQVFDVYGWSLRRIIESPAQLGQAGLPSPWVPVESVVDRTQHLWVVDWASGAVVVLHCQPGRMSLYLPAVPVRRLLAGRDNEVFAWLENDELYRLQVDRDGSVVATAVAGPKPVFEQHGIMSRAGYINMSGWCAGSRGEAWFDTAGQPVAAGVVPAAPALRYTSSGSWISGVLDSRYNNCQWDRIAVYGELPKGSRARLYTYTAEQTLDENDIKLLDDAQWVRCVELNSASKLADGEGDGPIRSVQGRFLWLKIVLEGDSNVTPRIAAVHADYPRISLRRYLPAVFGAESLSADFTDRLLAVFDRGLRHIERQIDEQARLFDADSAPHDKGRDFLSWLASWIGVRFFQGWTTRQKREFLKQAPLIFARRGTREGLVQQLLWYLGIAELDTATHKGGCAACSDAEPPRWKHPQMVLEHFRLRRWMFLGRGRLSEEANLWGEQLLARSRLDSYAVNGVTRLDNVKDALRDPFHFYAHQFSVFVPASCVRSEVKARAIKELVEREKPAHTRASIVFVQPRFRIGIQSMIGFDSVVGRWPAGVTLQDMKLGRATVLTSASNPQANLRVGSESRVGQTTVMK